jgi:tetratricopeptide (TPR) repeat protein
MRKHVLVLALATVGALLLATAATLAPSTAVAEEFSKAVGEPLIAAQNAMKKRQWDLAMAKAKEAAAVSNKKPHEEFAVNQVLAYLYTQRGDYANAAKLQEALLNSGRVPDGEVNARVKALAQAYAQKGNINYAKQIEYGTRYLKSNPNDAEMNFLVAQAQFQSGDCRNAVRSAQNAVDAARKGGNAPKENWLNLKLNCQYKLGDEEGQLATREQLVRYYPKKETWEPLLTALSNKAELDDRAKMNIYRLMLELDLLEKPDQYLEMAEIAIDQEPGEAAKVIQAGIDNKVLTGRNDERAKRILNHAQTKAQAKQSGLQAMDQQARQDPKGEADVNLGRAYLAAGQHDKAVEALQRGLKKGGFRNVDEAQMMLGRAYLKLKQKDQARRAFNAVPDDSKLAQVAQLWGVYAAQS